MTNHFFFFTFSRLCRRLWRNTSDYGHPRPSSKIRRRLIFPLFFLLFFWVCIIGCANTGKPQLQIERYIIDYSAPRFENLSPINETIRVDRFTIASVYNNNSMIFRRDNYGIDAFNYNRWAVNPADMLGDMLLRDIRESRLFRAAFSRYAVGEGRYVLQGGIEEFFLQTGKEGHFAIISLNMTLKDIKQRETTKQILFQKKYSEKKPLKTDTSRSYCEAMSLAMERLSRQIISDVYRTVRTAASF
ncbi:MAG: membrane integrity-associated transporter subunit PqiC [Deltaproteobacteria bacterium]|nr:membrane integrity-associated transporter subunit PqiC [Deltaproteobacteria bacterium]